MFVISAAIESRLRPVAMRKPWMSTHSVISTSAIVPTQVIIRLRIPLPKLVISSRR
ncbi:hypothetical protein D3C81_2272260 [compost metagenome]